MANLLRRFASDESGIETVEWTILAAILVGGLLAVLSALGVNMKSAFTALQTGTTLRS